MVIDPSKKYKPTIGLLINQIDDSYHNLICRALCEIGKKLKLKLLWFIGKQLDSPYRDDAQQNVIYKFISTKNVDGLILFSGALKNFIGQSDFIQFVESYQFIPLVSTSYYLPNYPSVTVDQKKGIRDAMEHLVHEHNRRRVAFIRGPRDHWEADQRFNAYKESLTEFNLPYDPRLVFDGDFVDDSGYEAIVELIDNRRVKFDALLASNDAMALAAMEALKERGFKIPKDISIIGFDDIEEAQISSPPLTTINQPLYEMIEKSVEMIVVPPVTKHAPIPNIVLKTKLIKRQSCGCPAQSAMVVPTGINVPSLRLTSQDEVLEFIRKYIYQELFQGQGNLGVIHSKIAGWLDELIQGMKTYQIDDPQSGTHLISSFYRILVESQSIQIELDFWQNLIFTIRNLLLTLDGMEPYRTAIDTTYQQMLMMATEIYLTHQKRRFIESERRALLVQEISQALINTFDLDELLNIISKELPRLDIVTCYIALYEGKVRKMDKFGWDIPKKSKLVLMYRNYKRFDIRPEDEIIDTLDLVPKGKVFQDVAGTILILPLVFLEEHFGYILFKVGDTIETIYETIRKQISSALETVFLYRARKEAEEELTKSLVRIRESEQRFREMALLLPTIIIETDMNLKISFINQAGYLALGLNDNESPEGKSLLELVSPKNHKKILSYSEDISTMKPTSVDEFSFIHKNGLTTLFLVKSTPISAGNKVKGIRWNAMNIKPLMSSIAFPNNVLFEKHKFSPRSKEVLLLTLQGFKTKDIAKRLFIAESTVKDYISDI